MVLNSTFKGNVKLLSCVSPLRSAKSDSKKRNLELPLWIAPRCGTFVDNKEHQAIFYSAIKNIFLPVSGHAALIHLISPNFYGRKNKIIFLLRHKIHIWLCVVRMCFLWARAACAALGFIHQHQQHLSRSFDIFYERMWEGFKNAFL